MEKAAEFDMPSGAKLLVCVGEYDRVIALHDAVTSEMRGKGVGALDVAKIQKAFSAARKAKVAAEAGKEAEDDGSGDEGLNVIVDKTLGLIGSREVKAALFACSNGALYCPDGTLKSSVSFNPEAAGFGVFDNPACRAQAREDYYAICRAIAEENLRPFGKALFSMFLALVGRSAADQTSDTAQG